MQILTKNNRKFEKPPPRTKVKILDFFLYIGFAYAQSPKKRTKNFFENLPWA
jgi:hypothetical protein